jgi:hypothetical protein
MNLHQLMLPTGIKSETAKTVADLFDWNMELKDGEIIFSTESFELVLREVHEEMHTPWALNFQMNREEFFEFKKRLAFFQFRKKDLLHVVETDAEVRLIDLEGNQYHIKKQ